MLDVIFSKISHLEIQFDWITATWTCGSSVKGSFTCFHMIENTMSRNYSWVLSANISTLLYPCCSHALTQPTPEIDQVRSVTERQVTAEHGFAPWTMSASRWLLCLLVPTTLFSSLFSVTLNVNTPIHTTVTSECQAGVITAAFFISLILNITWGRQDSTNWAKE